MDEHDNPSQYFFTGKEGKTIKTPEIPKYMEPRFFLTDPRPEPVKSAPKKDSQNSLKK